MSLLRLRPRFLLNISDGQPVNASASNSAWVSKTGDDSKSGKLDLTNPTSGPTVTNVQQTINDINDDLGTLQTTVPGIQSDISDLQTLSGVPDDSTDLGTFTGVTIPDNVDNKVALQALETEVELKENLANKGVADGYASLDSGGKVPVAQLPNSIMEYLGTWNASTNTPSLADGVGNAGDVYIVDVAGTQDLGSGNITFAVSDWIVYNGSIWQKSSNSNSVVSVNGFTGVVVLDLDDINDVSLTAPATREVLQYDGTDWVNVKLDLSANDNATGSNVTLTAVASSIVRLTNASLVSIDMIPAGYSAQKFVLTNATSVPVLISNDIGATAADRILTGTGADLTIANDASVILVYDITSSRWRIVGGSGSGSGSGGINYILNPNAVASTVGWSTYQDAAASQPVDGTGGSPTITLTKDTTSKIISTNSFKITKDAANRQGEGVPYDFTIDQALAGKNLELSFYYQATANFVYGSINGVTPSDITCYIYDITNSALVAVFPNVLDGSGQLAGSFQATQSLSYRLIFHIGTTNALAWDFYYGQVEVGPLDKTFLQSDSDWLAYTPTYVGAGTVSTSNMFYRKQGPNLEISGSFISGVATGVPFTMTLPPGLVSSATYTSTANDVVGQFGTNGGTAQFSALISQSSNLLGATYQSANNLTKQNGSAMWTSTFKVSVKASIRIDGWTSGYATAALSVQNSPVFIRAYKNAGAVTANTTIPTWTAVTQDATGTFNSTTGEATIKVPGTYDYSFKIATTAGTPTASIYKNGTEIEKGLNAGVKSIVAGSLGDLVVGDVITVRIDSSLTVASDNVSTVFSLKKVNSPNAFLNINRSTTKSFASDFSTDQIPLASIGFSNLVIGKKYRIESNFAFLATTSFNVTHTYTNNGAVVLKTYSAPVNGSTAFVSAVAEFTAAATTLVGNFDISNTGTVYGTGTLSNGNRFILTELNNTFEGNF